MFVAVTGLPNAARIVVLADSLRLGRMEATSNDGRVCASTLDIPRARVTAMTVALRCDVGTEPSSADDYRVLSGRLHARALTGEQNRSSRRGLGVGRVTPGCGWQGADYIVLSGVVAGSCTGIQSPQPSCRQSCGR